jgi:hypothetical protein
MLCARSRPDVTRNASVIVALQAHQPNYPIFRSIPI